MLICKQCNLQTNAKTKNNIHHLQSKTGAACTFSSQLHHRKDERGEVNNNAKSLLSQHCIPFVQFLLPLSQLLQGGIIHALHFGDRIMGPLQLFCIVLVGLVLLGIKLLPCKLQEKQMPKQSIVAILTGFPCSHSPYIIKHCENLVYFMPLYKRMIAQVLAFSEPCDLE